MWPHARIDLLCYYNTTGMLFENPDINEVIECAEHPRWPEYRTLLKKIFRRYDLSIVSQPSDRAHIYGFIAARHRIGIIPENPLHNWWKRLVCRRTITLNYQTQHVVSERFNLLEGYDPIKTRRLEVVTPSIQPIPQSIRSDIQSGYIVIHATPRWRFKRWPVSNWADLISRINKYNFQVILTGSNSLQDKELNADIYMALLNLETQEVKKSSLLDLTGQLSLAQTGSLLALATAYIGVDTSVTHLAAACGTKTVALFGPTPPTNYGPWPVRFSGTQPWQRIGDKTHSGLRVQSSANVCIVQGPGDCVPCRKSGCLNRFESHSACLDNLSSLDVFQSVISHLDLSSPIQ